MRSGSANTRRGSGAGWGSSGSSVTGEPSGSEHRKSPGSSRSAKVGIGRRKARPGKLIVDWRDGGGIRHAKEFPDSREGELEAREFEVKVRRQAKTGKPYTDERVTLGEYYAEWIQATKSLVANNTLKSRTSVFECHFLPVWEKVPLVRLNRSVVRTFLAGLLEKGYATSSVHSALTCIGALFAYAVDNGDLETNPVAQLGRKMRLGWSPDKILSLSREELGQFLAAAKQGTEYPTLALLAFSGVRISEGLGLQWGDLSFAENTLRVERQVHETGEVAPLKTAHSRRTVEIPGSLVETFRGRSGLPREGPWLLSPDWPPKVSWGPSGRRRRAIYEAMREALRLGSLPPHFTPHSLRHTFARLHLEAGRQVLWVSRQMGHSSLAITADRYGRFAKLKGEGAADALAASVEGQELRSKVTRMS